MATQVPHEEAAAVAALRSNAHAGGADTTVTVATASTSVMQQRLPNTIETATIITTTMGEQNSLQMGQEASRVSVVTKSGAAASGEEQTKNNTFAAENSDCFAAKTVASKNAAGSASSSGSTCDSSTSSTSGRKSGTDARKVQQQQQERPLSAAGTSLALTLVTCSVQERMHRILEMKKALDRFREDDLAENNAVRSALATAETDEGKRQTAAVAAAAGKGHASLECLPDGVKRMTPSRTPDVLEVFAVLDQVNMNREILSKTRIGVSVGKLRSHPNPQVRSRASELVSKWKASIGPAAASATADAQSPGAVSASAAAVRCGDAPVAKSSPAASSNARCGGSSGGSVSPNKSYVGCPSVASNSDSASETKAVPSTSITATQGSARFQAQAHNGGGGGDADKRGGGAQQGTASPGHASYGEFPGPLTGDSVRDRARVFLWKALLDGMQQQSWGGGTGGNAGGVGTAAARGGGAAGGETAAQVAAQVEEALWGEYCVRRRSTKEYTSQLKTLKWNFADPKNPDLNLKVLCGVFTPEQLATMTSAELASDEKKRLREQQKKESMEACQSDWEMKKLMQGAGADGQFPCFKCRTTKTVYFQMQTRSSDEPMTTFVTCLECGNRWKF